MNVIIAGTRESPVEQVSIGPALFRLYLRSLLSDSPKQVHHALTRAQRELLRLRRKRRGLISHSNWREYSSPDSIYGPKDVMPRRRLPVANGWRVKDRSSETPDYPLLGWPDDGVPTCWGPSGWISEPRTIAYGVGSLDEFHECFHSWTRSINSRAPFMGIEPRTRFTLRGYVHEPYTIPGWENSGYYESLSTFILAPTLDRNGYGSRYLRRLSWPTRTVGLTQAQIEYARRLALASMYGGTPSRRPNFLRSLIELKDTRQTIRGLVHFYQWGRAVMSHGCLWERVGGMYRRLSGVAAMRRSIGEMAGAYLNYVFGIQPTLSDIGEFLQTIRQIGVGFLKTPQGQKATPGLVITSHYQVRPERDRLKMPSFSDTRTWQWIFTGGYHQNEISDDLSTRYTWSRSLINKYPEVLESRLYGCVFARIKQSNSQYFWDNFGHVGWTWSYPMIETTWELLPWSWLIDWFAKTRQKIRLAEREARTYWMRIGFEEPWIAERLMTFRHCYDYLAYTTCRTDRKARWYPYYAEQCFAQMESVVSLVPKFSVPVSCQFYRKPLASGSLHQGLQEVPITVRTFQISVGMALVLNNNS